MRRTTRSASARRAPPRLSGACACTGRGCAPAPRSAALPPRPWTAARDGSRAPAARTGCASRRRAAGGRSPPRLSRRRTPGPCTRPEPPPAGVRAALRTDTSPPRACARRCSARCTRGAGTRRRRAPSATVGNRHAHAWAPPPPPLRRCPCRPGAAAEPRRRPRPGVPPGPATARASRPPAARSPRSAAAHSDPRARVISAESFSALPRRCPSAITSSTAGCARAARAEPSREPLSSTSTSVANGSSPESRSRAMASSPRSSSSRWEVFTTQYAQLDLGLVRPIHRGRIGEAWLQRSSAALSPHPRLLCLRCASTSSIPRPIRRRTTTRCAARLPAPAPR